LYRRPPGLLYRRPLADAASADWAVGDTADVAVCATRYSASSVLVLPA